MAQKGSVLPEQQPREASSVWNRDVILILIASLLVHANISVFFHFYGYLQTLAIDPKWFGLLLGVFSGICLVVRPVLSSFFHLANARRFLFVGAGLVSAALASYSLAEGFRALFVVRALHGLGFVVLGTALMTLTVHYIPKGRSGQAFGLVSIVVLLPNVIVPPLMPFLTNSLGNFSAVLILFAAITALVFPVIKAIKTDEPAARIASQTGPLRIDEIVDNFANPRIVLLLLAMLFFYGTYALAFFFLDGYGRSLGISNTGLFLSIALATEIVIRIAAGRYFDRLPKDLLVAGTVVCLGLSYGALAHVSCVKEFMLLAIFVGLGWGVAMPVFNGLMFDSSAFRYRSFNVNLGLQTFQGGLFLGPLLGAPIVASWGYTALFYLCGALCFAAAGLSLATRMRLPTLSSFGVTVGEFEKP